MLLWIQLHDFSSEEMPIVNAMASKRAFSEFDWAAELTRQKEALEREEDCCDPGMGLVSDNGSILHLCPIDEKFLSFHYHYLTIKKEFVFVSTESEEMHYVEKFPISEINDVINLHFAGDKLAILQIEACEVYRPTV